MGMLRDCVDRKTTLLMVAELMTAKSKTKEKDAHHGYLHFRRPENNCLLCGEAIHGDGHHPSVIKYSATEDVIRNDFCPKCWEQMEDRQYFSFWVTKRIEAPTAEERRLLRSERNEALWRLFSALYDSDRTQEVGPQLFLLAHLLMRFKVLIFKGQGEDGRLEFEHTKLELSFKVEDYPLDAVDFVKVKDEVEQKAIDFAPSNQSVAQEVDSDEEDADHQETA